MPVEELKFGPHKRGIGTVIGQLRHDFPSLVGPVEIEQIAGLFQAQVHIAWVHVQPEFGGMQRVGQLPFRFIIFGNFTDFVRVEIATARPRQHLFIPFYEFVGSLGRHSFFLDSDKNCRIPLTHQGIRQYGKCYDFSYFDFSFSQLSFNDTVRLKTK